MIANGDAVADPAAIADGDSWDRTVRLKTSRPGGLRPRFVPPPQRREQIQFSLDGKGPLSEANQVQKLLRKRLRALTLITLIGWSVAWAHRFFRIPLTDDTLSMVFLPGGIFLAVVLVLTLFLWLRPGLSLESLRYFELIFFGVVTVFWCWEHYLAIHRGGWGWLHHYAGKDLREMAILARHPSIMWFALIVGYGTFIPNTWKRCALITGTMALCLLGLNLLLGLQSGIDAGHLMTYLIEIGVWTSTAVAFAIYGSHKISVLSQKANEARKLGQYTLRQRLGTGGMGEVYLAEHLLLRRPCAVKLIRPECAGDMEALRHFEREVQAMATLTHWNTVDVFDYGHAADGTFYYAMEYLPGLTLESLVQQYGPLPPERAVHLLRQVCRALHEAHSIGLIHRDIKPGNIMACERGGVYDVAKLLDFGLVEHVETASAGEERRDIAGTPAYMSPEQGLGKDRLDARSDIYSLGGVAYFLLTGKPPFGKKDTVELLTAKLQESVDHAELAAREVPDDLQAVVLRCLEKHPSNRFQDVDSLDAALGECECAGKWSEADAAEWWRHPRVAHHAHYPSLAEPPAARSTPLTVASTN